MLLNRLNHTGQLRVVFQSVFILIFLAGLIGQENFSVFAAPGGRPLTNVPPSLSLAVPSEVFIGENVAFTVTFDNTDTVPGYGPLIDLIIPANGADGAQNTNPPLDGLTFVSATYLGSSIENTVLTFPGSGGVTCVNHPYMVNNTGAPVQVCGNAGDTFVALRLPFGSFTPDQPPLTVNVTTSMSNLADLGTPLTIQARGGYQFGYDPLNNYTTDDPSATLSAWTSDSVTPILFTLTKTYNGPEDETATGPNFPRQYTVTAKIAPGQTMTSFNLTDTLPPNMQFVSLVSTTPGGASCTTPSTTTPGGTLSCNFTSVSGTVTMTFEYYIPLRDAGGASVIDPASGDDALSCNNASGGGTWTPLDPRDTGGAFTQDPAGCEHTLTDKSIAIQKSASVLGGGDPAPGQTLEYTLDFQVSDFFAFQNVVVNDVISDGQHFDSSFTPTLQINGNTYTLVTAGFNAANYDVTCNYSGGPGPECTADDPAANDGTTTLTFRVSDEIITRGQDGRLIGGCVPTSGVTGDPLCSGYNDGPTTGRIVFRTVIQENFTDTFPSGDSSVDQGDTLNNTVTISGDLLSTSDASTPTGQSEADNSAASVSIGRGTLTKAIYAVNGSTSFGMPVEVKPGDTVTYRLTYTLPTGDVENLEFQDFLPLPVFHVGDPDEDGAPGPAWTFSTLGGIPAAGVATFGPSDTFYAYSAIVPTITSDSGNNRLAFTYGNFDGPTEQPYTVDILFTVTVSDDPFADRLYLTNQANASEGSTNAGTAEANAIVQIILTEPVLVMKKGIIWTSNSNATFSPTPPGPVTFLPPTNSPRWSGTINSTNLASTPINSNLNGVDSGDIVTFAIVIENIGSSGNGAFDIRLKDDLPANFVTPSGGINLQVYQGDGTALSYTDLGGGLFNNGIEINDPGPAQGACQQYDPTNGKNIVLVTFDLEVASTVPPAAQITNTATLFNYAGSEGGPDHTTSDLTDPASVTTSRPLLTKALTSTNQTFTTDPNVAVGEQVTYTITITVPEGTIPNAVFGDTLDPGLAFVSCDSITASPSVSASGGFDCANATFSNNSGGIQEPGEANARALAYNFGTITNSDTDNNTAETITIQYTAVALNSASINRGWTRSNYAGLWWDGGSQGANVTSVTVVEPTLQVDKTAAPTSGDAGDTITYTAVISHTAASNADAFEAHLRDDLSTLPVTLNVASISVTPSGCSPTVTDNSTATLVDLTLTPFPLGCSATVTYQVTLNGTVFPGQVITNTAGLDWSSLPGDVSSPQTPNNDLSCERSGDSAGCGGTNNDYTASDPALVTVTVAPLKSIVATSEDSTGPQGGTERLVIGEIVRYRLQVQWPEGASPNAMLRDYLPPGLQFLNDNTAKVAFVCNGGGACMSSSNPGIGSSPVVNGNETNVASITPTFVLPDDAVSASATTNDDTYGSSTDPYFKFSDLVNSDNDSDQEFVVVEFNALVLNISSNQSGTGRGNSFAVMVDGTVRATSNTVTLSIAEPTLSLTKAVTTAPTDAGDTLTYTLTITNTSSGDNRATAFDLELTDTLDTYLNINSVNIATTQTSPCVGPSGVGTTTFSANYSWSGTPTTVTVTASCLDPAQTITITINATVAANAPAGYTIPNTANLTYTSLPGANGASSNPTGSVTPGTSGSGSGERNGQDGVGGALNDYAAAASANAPLAAPQIDKLDPSPASYPIGAQVTFNLLVTLPEGLTPNLQVVDDLPVGLEYLSHQVITTAAASGGLLAADYNGTLPDPTVTAPGGSGGDLTLVFGDTTTAADNVANNNTFLVQVVARVLNEAGNQNGTVLTNTATVSWTGGSASDSVNITVIEPELDVQKAVDDTTPAYGQTLTYTLTVSHLLASSTATAYDITVTDTIPSGLTYASGSITAPAGCTADDTAAPTLTWTCSSLPVGSTLTLTYQAVVVNAPPAPPPAPGDNLVNNVSMTWTSLSGTDLNERSGSGGVNDYLDTTSQTVTLTTHQLEIVKSSVPNTYVPGNSVTYTVIVRNVGNSDATGAAVSDVIPAQISSWAWACTAQNNGASGCDPYSGNADFNDIVNLPVNASIEYTVTAQTYSSASGDLVNTAQVTLGGSTASDSETDTPDLQADLSVTKDDGLTVVAPGSIITYTITVANAGPSDANGVTVSDPIPSQITSWEWSCTPTGGATCNGSGGPISTNFSDTVNMPAGSTITYTVTATISDTASGTLTNTVTVTPPSGVTDPTPANNSDDDADIILTLPGSDLTKSLIATNQGFTPGASVAIGELVTYRITFTVPAGGSLPNLTLTDLLDRGLAFMDCLGVAASDPTITTTLPGGFGDACNDPTNPTIATEPPGSTNPADPGRKVTFNLGTVSNGGASDGTVTVEYTAVVLDSLENQDGLSLNNGATLVWDSGTLTTSAPNVTIVEPDFEVQKEVDRTVALPGSILTFTITLRHINASNVDAFDVALTDKLPSSLEYVPGSLRILSGPSGGIADDSASPTLRVTWDSFPLLTGGRRTEAVIEFQAKLGDLLPGQQAKNTAALAWTSLPGAVQNPQSLFNPLSTERFYDPGSAVNIYGVFSSVIITVPRLPSTGFAPGVTTSLPPQPAEKAYANLGDFWLEIPRLGVQIPIVGIPAKGDEWDLTWLWGEAGWLEGTAYPTHSGNAALTAHVNLPNGAPGPFFNLINLRWGDQIIVHLGGQRYIYEVRQVRQVSPYTLSVLQHQDMPYLTLITCREYDKVYDSYRYRVVVTAVLTSVEPVP